MERKADATKKGKHKERNTISFFLLFIRMWCFQISKLFFCFINKNEETRADAEEESKKKAEKSEVTGSQ
jgi:flagellar basal body-associated protein FliL